MFSVKLLASQAKHINHYKNLRIKVLNCCASIYFNRRCLKQNIVPKYARIKIPNTSPASKTTQKKTQITRMKDEIKYLYMKKDHLNDALLKAHLQAASEWGSSWELIRESIHNTVNSLFEKKYKNLDEKISRLTNTQKEAVQNNTTFYPRVENKTDIPLTKEELDLLNKGLKYNLDHKHRHWINNLALEAENAVTLLPPVEQEYTWHQEARNIRKLLTQETLHKREKFNKGKEELRILNQIKEKLHENKAIITKADKGNSVVIIYEDEYIQKVKDSISNNEASETSEHITAKFPKHIRTPLIECKQLIDTHNKWKYIKLNPGTLVLRVLIKVHKEDTPIRLIVNFRNAPNYNIAKMMANILMKYIPLPSVYNIQNSVELIKDLENIPCTPDQRLASLDISNMYKTFPRMSY